MFCPLLLTRVSRLNLKASFNFKYLKINRLGLELDSEAGRSNANLFSGLERCFQN